MILQAAELVVPGKALVLGAGGCEEIPLAELVARFSSVTLNDIDEAKLRQALCVRDMDTSARAKVDLQIADLSGVTGPAIARIEEVVAANARSTDAIGAMARVLDEQPPGEFPIAGRFELVVASCVLSQLHFRLAQEAAGRFKARFPDCADELDQSDVWKHAVYRLARRMEERLVDEMRGLVADGGLVYLSETVQVCYITLTPDGRWQTEGTFRMLRTQDLADYVQGRLQVLLRGRWEWIVSPPIEAGQTGRLYDVQALVLRHAHGA
jgi:hypothetical protein